MPVVMAAIFNPLTNTSESGTYYAGKEKADRAYGQILTAQGRNGVMAQGQNIAALQVAAAKKAAQQQSLDKGYYIKAAETAAEKTLQDEIGAENAQQSERTFQYAQSMANAPRTPGGSIKRGAGLSIGAATGSGLAKANADARRKVQLEAARAQGELAYKQAQDAQKQQQFQNALSAGYSGVGAYQMARKP